MDILIVGLGEVGSHLAKVLASENHEVTVIDTQRQRLRRVSDVLDVRAVYGDGSKPETLDRAGADRADLLLAVSNDDNVNMLACLFGKRIGAKRTVLRVKDMAPFNRFRTFFRKNLLFDLILSLEDLAAEEIVKTLRENQAIGVENFADGKVQMRRLRLAEGSALIGVPLKELKIPPGMLVTAIDRDHEVIIPGGDDTCQLGDDVFVLGEPKAIAMFEKKSGFKATSLRSVVMTGATSVVVQVCKSLERRNVQTKVIVPDREDAEQLATLLKNTLVLHGEATDLDQLKEENVGEADAFLGLSTHDEMNLMSCQLASSLGVKRTIALVQKPDYVSLYHQLGIDVSISPRLLCASRILSFVRSGSVSTIATIEEGQAEVLELEIPAGSRLVGKQIKDARFPKGCVVGAIARENGDIVIPRGDDLIEAQDNLVVFVMNSVVEKLVSLVGDGK